MSYGPTGRASDCVFGDPHRPHVYFPSGMHACLCLGVPAVQRALSRMLDLTGYNRGMWVHNRSCLGRARSPAHLQYPRPAIATALLIVAASIRPETCPVTFYGFSAGSYTGALFAGILGRIRALNADDDRLDPQEFNGVLGVAKLGGIALPPEVLHWAKRCHSGLQLYHYLGDLLCRGTHHLPMWMRSGETAHSPCLGTHVAYSEERATITPISDF